uniref:Uncharacterized protein n=1 Tax=Rhizophora mucronata TaxID=61149 RepID=A0A2P2MLD5_RHIMU
MVTSWRWVSEQENMQWIVDMGNYVLIYMFQLDRLQHMTVLSCGIFAN